MTKLKTTDIGRGKKYVQVDERLRYLRENYPNVSLLSEMLSNENGVCIFKTSLVVEDKVVAIGHAYEKEGSTFINKTSYIENCETSSWGRCLANFGIGIHCGVASAEEVSNAIINQSPENVKAKKSMTDDVPRYTVQGALDELQKAFAAKDFDLADQIKAWAEKNDVPQVYDKHAMLFASKN